MRLICDNCGKQFKAANVMKQHQVIHTGENLFQCKICDKSFTQSGTLQRHKESHKTFPCSQCAKSFELEVELNIHQQELICQTCGKHFRIPTDLKKHQIIHTGKNNLFPVTDVRNHIQRTVP